jgi:hypothetical protein
MKDLKKIQEFFSKSLEEGKQLDKSDFDKVVQAVKKTGHPVTVLLVPKSNEIEVITGMDAPDDMIRDLSNAVDSLGYGRNDIFIAGDSTNLSRREYSDIESVNEMSMNEMDMNDPVMIRMRAAKMKASQPTPEKTTNPNYPSNKNSAKLAFLKKERAQLMRDMEQEAEPEGGPIADEYGRKLNRIDAAIVKLSGRKEMTYDQAIAEGKGKMPTQSQVDRFFILTQNETHYLNNKPVQGQKKTSSNMEVEPWDEYDLSNWNALVKKAKAKGKSLAEDNSYARVSMPRFKKDKNNSNFLNVYIDYDLGPGGSSIALGKETMTGQIRKESAAEAMRLAGDVARDLEAEYDLEDIDIQDLKNGKVRIFAVSDDFINMDPNMLGESLNENDEEEEVDYSNISSLEDELRRLRRWSSQYGSKGADSKIEYLEQRIEYLKSNPLNEDESDVYRWVNNLKYWYDKSLNAPDVRNTPGGQELFKSEVKKWVSTLNEAKGSHFEIGDVVELKSIPETLPFEIRNGGIDNKWEITRVSKSGRSMYSDMMEDVFGYDIELLDKKLKYKMFAYPEDVKQSMNEAKEEDKIDIITMDVPLFIRALEYAKEDAQEDMDLHDFAERAIAATKEQGILQMDDYDMLVGGKEPMDESNITEASVPSNIKSFAKRKGVTALVNKVAGWAEKVGARISGGTAIGYNYSTLVLDMKHQAGEIRINTDNDTIKLYNTPVNSFPEFKKIYDEKNPIDKEKTNENVAQKVIDKIKEAKPGLWANINAKKKNVVKNHPTVIQMHLNQL